MSQWQKCTDEEVFTLSVSEQWIIHSYMTWPLPFFTLTVSITNLARNNGIVKAQKCIFSPWLSYMNEPFLCLALFSYDEKKSKTFIPFLSIIPFKRSLRIVFTIHSKVKWRVRSFGISIVIKKIFGKKLKDFTLKKLCSYSSKIIIAVKSDLPNASMHFSLLLNFLQCTCRKLIVGYTVLRPRTFLY